MYDADWKNGIEDECVIILRCLHSIDRAICLLLFGKLCSGPDHFETTNRDGLGYEILY